MIVAVMAVLAAVPVPVKLAAPGFVAINLDPKVAELVLDRFVVLAKNDDLSVVTARDISLVLGLERQRQLMGCSTDNASCIVELAGALGTDAVLSGTVAKTERSVTLVLRAIRATDAAELVSATVRVANEDELQEWIEEHARGFAEELVAKVRGVPVRSSSSATWPKWLALGGGVALGGVGAGLRGAAEGSAGALRGASPSNPVNVDGVVSDGKAFEASGNTLIAVGAAALATGAVLFAVQPSAPVAFVPVPGGAGFVVQGRF